MIGRLVMALSMMFGIVAAVAGPSAAQAQNADCRFFKVRSNSLNIAKEPRSDSPFVDALNKNDILCVTRNQQVGDREWGYIVYRLENQKQQPVEGWAIMGLLQPATAEELAAVKGSPAPAPPAAAEAEATAAGEPIVRFSEPIPFGAYPVVGHSLEELITGTPMFPPIPGLDDKLWKGKHCDACHQWNRQSLCEQASIYAKNPGAAVRIQHPYGGPDKVAMTNWAKNGCQ